MQNVVCGHAGNGTATRASLSAAGDTRRPSRWTSTHGRATSRSMSCRTHNPPQGFIVRKQPATDDGYPHFRPHATGDRAAHHRQIVAHPRLMLQPSGCTLTRSPSITGGPHLGRLTVTADEPELAPLDLVGVDGQLCRTARQPPSARCSPVMER